MYPLVHIYVAKKKFGRLTNDITAGSIAPDLFMFLPGFSQPITHRTLTNFKHTNFKRAYKLHVTLDDYMHKNYLYKLIPKDLKKELGRDLGHLYVEAAFDYLLWKDGIFYKFPKIKKSIIHDLEKVYNKSLVLERLAEHFEHWKDKKSYPKFLVKSLRILNVHTKPHYVLADSQTKKYMIYCANTLKENYLHILNSSIKDLGVF